MSEPAEVAIALDGTAPGLDLQTTKRSGGSRFLPALLLVCALAAIGAAITTQVSPTWLSVGLQKLSDGRGRSSPAPSSPSSVKLAREDAAATRQAGNARTAAPAVASGTGDTLTYGDRLKITFIESTGVSLGGEQSSSGRPVAIVFPRMDLSAEYTVDANGGVDIPKLGRVAAAGSSIEALRSALTQAFASNFGRTSDVRVVIVDRLPIYVVGAVRAAGKIAYQPGMIVLQALASAGGSESGPTDTSAAIEDIRQTSQLHLATDRLDRLLVERAKLIAERDDAVTVTLPPSIAARLSQGNPGDRLNSLVAATQASLAADRSHFHDSQVLVARQIEAIKMQLAAQQHRNDQLQELLSKKQEKLRTLQAVAQRGSIPDYMIMQAETAIAELIARQEDLRVTFAQTQSSLVEAEAARAKLNNDHAAGIEAGLSTTQQNIDDSIQQVASAKAVLRVLQKTTQRDLTRPGGSAVTIARRMAGQWQVMPAAQETALLPGDVVRVGVMTHDFDRTASEDTKSPQGFGN